MNAARCRVTVLTPAGRGAVASIAVEGDDADHLVGQFFAPANARRWVEGDVSSLRFGRWAGPQGEEVIVCRREPSSYEIHSHGGHAAVAAIVRNLLDAGAEQGTWQDWLAGARSGTTEREALALLPHAPTRRTAAILWDQSSGALREAIEQTIDEISTGDAVTAAVQLSTLTDRSAAGRHLVEPFRVVLAGEPNVGKSTLINALLGYSRALVADEPGTTRDVVSAMTAIDGWPVELADTAGLRDTANPIEREGVARTRQAMLEADVLLLVFDASQAWTDACAPLVAQWPTALVVQTKCDLPLASSQQRPGIRTSAITRAGLDELLDVLASRLVGDPPAPGAAVPFLDLHVERFEAARTALDARQIATAIAILRDLL
ncbi:MAG TPA: GTPase [Pirellulales bacterium]|jgi:tRNA modification GTPase|nr:GTPase [Pirellulales bacterium]